MDYIFGDIDETLRMVEGAYKKLKSFYFFDKTYVFVKERIADFESNKELFPSVLEKISENLKNKNSDYFQALINEIAFRVLPKKFESKRCLNNCINTDIDHQQAITRINFFIDMPIELYILDFLWTLLIGKISFEQKDSFKYAAATRFKKSVFNANHELKQGIDFDSNRLFEPYFGLYSAWRNRAFKTIEKQHRKSNTILLCLDLKSFYYSVEFSFIQILDYLGQDKRLSSFDFLTTIIENIYSNYTQLISQYKKGIRNNKNSCIFPIGIASPLVLRELYLRRFDATIAETLTPLYYSRYVDDMLIVLKTNEEDLANHNEIINKYLIDTEIIKKSNENELKFNGYNNIRVQKNKINSFFFQKNKKSVFFDIYAKAININSSEANLLPDIDVLNSSFTQNSYNIQNLEISNKVRDLGFLQNNNLNATRFINGLQRILKNTIVEKNILDSYLNEIVEFYQGSQSIEFSNNWRSIFELFLLANDKEKARSLFLAINNEIDSIDFEYIDEDEIYEKKKQFLTRHIKEHLREKLTICIALATSLDINFSIKLKIKRLAQRFRTSNMLNHTMVSFPLSNYSIAEDFPLNNIGIIEKISKENNLFKLDKNKLKWSPRYINAIEFFIANFLHGFSSKDRLTVNPNTIFDRFIKHNNLGQYLENQFGFSSNESNRILHYNFAIRDNLNINPKIALVNTKIEEAEALLTVTNPRALLTIDNKRRLFKILNTAKEEDVDILVFPEFYFPTAWLVDIAIFAVKNNISIITGLQYLTNNGQAFNNVCMVVPIITDSRFSTGFVQMREKNFYAPKEKIELSKRGFFCKDLQPPVYYIFDNGKFRFSTILCYEFTDIESRTSMKAKVETLFVPQLNRDTNYFSAIVESTTRDLHCFVVQANTSSYGDSRVTAPYKTQYKNILQVKGGENDVVMIANLDISSMRKARKKYPVDLTKAIYACGNCKKIRQRNISIKKKEEVCSKCVHSLLNNKIKGTPPNFVL